MAGRLPWRLLTILFIWASVYEMSRKGLTCVDHAKRTKQCLELTGLVLNHQPFPSPHSCRYQQLGGKPLDQPCLTQYVYRIVLESQILYKTVN